MEGEQVVFELPRRRNLILDAGLNYFCSAALTYDRMFDRLWYGTGSTPTKRDSGAITFTRAEGSNVIVSSGNFFDGEDIGRLLKFDSGEEVYITGFTDSTHALCNAGAAIAASEGTLWYVNRAGLGVVLGQTSTTVGLGDAAKTGSMVNGNTVTSRRTFRSDVFTQAAIIRELGWGSPWDNQVFGTDYLPVGLNIGVGQALRVTIIWSVTYPDQLTPLVVSGGPLKAGTLSNDSGGGIWSGVCSMINTNSGAREGAWYGFAMHEPACDYVQAAPALEPFTQGVGQETEIAGWNLKSGYMSVAPYVPGSFKTVYEATWAPGVIVGTLYGIVFGRDQRRVTHKLDTPLVLTDTQQLSCTFEISVGRLLVN